MLSCVLVVDGRKSGVFRRPYHGLTWQVSDAIFVLYWNAVLLLCVAHVFLAFFVNIDIGLSVYAGGSPMLQQWHDRLTTRQQMQRRLCGRS